MQAAQANLGISTDVPHGAQPHMGISTRTSNVTPNHLIIISYHRVGHQICLYLRGLVLCLLMSSLRIVSILTCIRHRKIHTITLVNVQDISICLPRSSLSIMTILILLTYSKVRNITLICLQRVVLYRCYVAKSPYITDDHIHPKPVRAMSISHSLVLQKLVHKGPN